MRRRDFVGCLAGAAMWPVTAPAQQSTVPVIGILGLGSSNASVGVTAIHKGLGEAGYAEGRNLVIEYRWAETQFDRLPALAADLVQRRVALILALGGDQPALAAKSATTTIPIVFATPQNPVEIGLVASFNRPGGNVTGVVGFTDDIAAKRLELLHELVRNASLIAMLSNPNERTAEIERANVAAAATALKLRLEIVNAGRETELEGAFEKMVQRGVGALFVASSPPFIAWRERVIALAARHRIPACFHRREYVESGGLFSYGADIYDGYRRAGIYAGRILNVEKPAGLPILQPTKIEMAINLKTARALGVRVPQTLLVAADEVIE